MLKDWKKTGKDSSERLHSDSAIQYNKKDGTDYLEVNNLGSSEWEFESEKEVKKFKTKSQAISFAKNYMRRN